MKRITRHILTIVVVCAVLLASTAAPVSAAPTDTTEREGEARTVLATPGQPSDRDADHTTDVTGEIILEEGRETGTPTVSGTITITTNLPENVPEDNVNLPNGRKIIREVGQKK